MANLPFSLKGNESMAMAKKAAMNDKGSLKKVNY